VIFLDSNLPGMSGFELCGFIRNERPMAIIHAITGNTKVFELCECREAGFDDYFARPANLKEFSFAAQVAFKKVDLWQRRYH